MDEETRIPLSPTQSLPRVGKVASKASRIGFWRYEKERGRLSQVRDYTRAPERRPKRKPTPPRCARQPLPREGARVDTPSFLWKEVPRRGGGWMGIAVSSTQSLPRVGKVASGASRIGFWRYEKERSRLSQVRRLREHPSAAEKGSQPRLAVPLAPSKGRGSRGHS